MDMWRSARNKGVQGIPELNKDLEHDAKEARDMCIEFSDAAAEVEASIDDHEIESERQTDDYECPLRRVALIKQPPRWRGW